MGHAGTRGTWLALTIVLLAGLAGCAAPGAEQASAPEACQQDDWTKTEADTGDFTLCHPEGWQQQSEMPGFEADLWLVAGDAETGERFATNLNVLSMDVPEEMTFDEFVDANVRGLPQMITDYEPGKSERLDRQLPTHELTYTGRQGVHEIEWHQRLIYDEPTAYVITFAEPVDEDPVSEDTVEDVMDSFSTT